MPQLPFDFAHPPSLAPEDYIASQSNAAAFGWIERWPDWPAPMLCLSGPAGAGKTHLASRWRARSGAVALAPDRLAEAARVPALLESARAFVIDDLADGLAPEIERGLLHFYNGLAERKGHLLLVARTPPARWRIGLADLRSRLAAAPAVTLGQPDDLLLRAVLTKLFADRQLAVSADVVGFLASRIERSLAAAAAVVAALDRETLALGRGVTLPQVREALERLGTRSAGSEER